MSISPLIYLKPCNQYGLFRTNTKESEMEDLRKYEHLRTQDIRYLAKHYGDLPDKQIALDLDVSMVKLRILVRDINELKAWEALKSAYDRCDAE
jgi:hypothetical protein